MKKPMFSKKQLCLLDDFLNEPKTLPCKKCSKRKRPFAADSHEYGQRYYWWTAEGKDGRTIIFRIPKRPRGRGPEWRFNEIMAEYENAVDFYIQTYGRKYHDNLNRAVLWVFSKVNAGYKNYIGFELKRFRPATACETMAWISTHQDDFILLKDPEGFMLKLEKYV